MTIETFLYLLGVGVVIACIGTIAEHWNEMTKAFLQALVRPVVALLLAVVVYPGNAVFSKSLASVTVADGSCLLISAALAYYAVRIIIAVFFLWREAAAQ